MQLHWEDRHRTFVKHFLIEVPQYGWNSHAIESASLKMQQSSVYGFILFPGGESEIAKCFADMIDWQMEEHINKYGIEGNKIREKVRNLILLRLKFNTPYKEALKCLVKSKYIMLNFLPSLNLLWNTANNIWYYLGDESVDFNFYSKRGLLSYVYARVLLFWFEDYSENMVDTAFYTDKQIDKVLKIGQAKIMAKDMVTKVTKLPFIRLLTKKIRR